MRGLTHWIDRFDASSLRGDTSFGINHLEHGLENQACRDQVLRLVEMLVYRHDRSVRIASTRDPLHVLSAIAGAAEPGTAEGLKRWRGVLQSFRRWNVGLVRNNNYLTDLQALVPGASPTVLGLVTAECSFSPQLQQAGKEVIRQLPEGKGSTSEVLALIGVAAESYYWSLWSARTWDEQVVLRQLADEGVVNRKNLAVLEQLKRHGLIVHRGRFEIMNETFKRFIKCAVSSDVVRAWERDGAQMTWSNFRTGLSAAAITLVILAFLTEYQLVTTWIGYAPALAPVVPIFMRFFAKGTDGDAGKSGANA
jgi:hypothetical protein